MFELTEDQNNLQHTVREWARSELAPIAYELDQKAESALRLEYHHQQGQKAHTPPRLGSRRP